MTGEEPLVRSYIKTLQKHAEGDDQFWEYLTLHQTRGGRRVVARHPEDLYPQKSQHLLKDHAEKIAPGWWVNTNLSDDQIKSRLKIADFVVFMKDVR